MTDWEVEERIEGGGRDRIGKKGNILRLFAESAMYENNEKAGQNSSATPETRRSKEAWQ